MSCLALLDLLNRSSQPIGSCPITDLSASMAAGATMDADKSELLVVDLAHYSAALPALSEVPGFASGSPVQDTGTLHEFVARDVAARKPLGEDAFRFGFG